jgi:hypothetical protein
VRPNASKTTRPDTVITWVGAVPAWGETEASCLNIASKLAAVLTGRLRSN